MGTAPYPRGATTRRRLLAAAAAGLALGACGRSPRGGAAAGAGAGPPAGGAAVVTATDTYYTWVPDLAARFNAAQAGARIGSRSPAGSGLAGAQSPYALTWGQPNLSGGIPADQPLDAALAALNFDPSMLQAGALDGCRLRGDLVGLPSEQRPAAVAWRRDAFSAAGLEAPGPQWTLQQFGAAAAGIQEAIAAGGLPAVRWAVYPELADEFLAPAWWVGFALGYGGSVVSGGQFAFDGPALEGLAAYADLIRRFGPPLSGGAVAAAAAGPASAASAAFLDQFAMLLTAWVPPGLPGLALDGKWAWARVPRFPVRPVVPTWTPGLHTQEAAEPARGGLAAAVQAMVWLYQPDAQALLQASGVAPVLADPQVQTQFWGALAPALGTRPGAQAVGDWSNFLPYDSGWTAYPGQHGLGASVIIPSLAQPSQLPQLAAAWARLVNHS